MKQHFIINTPPSTHYKYIKILLSSKRDFIVEKPIFTNPNQVIACRKYFYMIEKLSLEKLLCTNIH